MAPNKLCPLLSIPMSLCYACHPEMEPLKSGFVWWLFWPTECGRTDVVKIHDLNLLLSPSSHYLETNMLWRISDTWKERSQSWQLSPAPLTCYLQVDSWKSMKRSGWEVGDHERVGFMVSHFRAVTLCERFEVASGVDSGGKRVNGRWESVIALTLEGRDR